MPPAAPSHQHPCPPRHWSKSLKTTACSETDATALFENYCVVENNEWGERMEDSHQRFLLRRKGDPVLVSLVPTWFLPSGSGSGNLSTLFLGVGSKALLSGGFRAEGRRMGQEGPWGLPAWRGVQEGRGSRGLVHVRVLGGCGYRSFPRGRGVSPFSWEGTEAQDKLNDLVRGSSIQWHIF